jgi:hypothetical protein
MCLQGSKEHSPPSFQHMYVVSLVIYKAATDLVGAGRLACLLLGQV